MKKLNKMLLGFGSITAVVAPVAAVVACGSDAKEETKINGKTAAQIKAMTPAQFTTFLNDTLHKAQPDTLTDAQKKFAFKVTSKTEFGHYDTKGDHYPLNVTDVNAKDFLANLGVYTTTPAGAGNGGATSDQIQKGKDIKPYWKDIVEAAKIYFAK